MFPCQLDAGSSCGWCQPAAAREETWEASCLQKAKRLRFWPVRKPAASAATGLLPGLLLCSAGGTAMARWFRPGTGGGGPGQARQGGCSWGRSGRTCGGLSSSSSSSSSGSTSNELRDRDRCRLWARLRTLCGFVNLAIIWFQNWKGHLGRAALWAELRGGRVKKRKLALRLPED